MISKHLNPELAPQARYILPQFTERTHTGERIEADSDRDRWFTAQEDLEYGFVDHIITRAHISGASNG